MVEWNKVGVFKMSSSVFVITFKSGGMHMVVASQKLAEEYCKKNCDKYEWEEYAVIKTRRFLC